jgi:hypothetical protein
VDAFLGVFLQISRRSPGDNIPASICPRLWAGDFRTFKECQAFSSGGGWPTSAMPPSGATPHAWRPAILGYLQRFTAELEKQGLLTCDGERQCDRLGVCFRWKSRPPPGMLVGVSMFQTRSERAFSAL